ncbi:MAG TPA: His-Xaa-Ser system protein HxsD [Chthoniobacterales bacterium]|nr:His-Xaa-Ser system protein HxsD [Chthoniobacterales bacterium]
MWGLARDPTIRKAEKYRGRGGDRRPFLPEKFVFHWGNDRQAWSQNEFRESIILFSRNRPVKIRGLTAQFLHQDGEGLLVEVDLGVYSLPSLLKVAHKFTDRCFVHLQQRDERSVEVRFQSKNAEVPLDAIAGEFCNEILDQTLREIVARESEPVRNIVMAHALSRINFTNLESKPPHTTNLPSQQAQSPQTSDAGLT